MLDLQICQLLWVYSESMRTRDSLMLFKKYSTNQGKANIPVGMHGFSVEDALKKIKQGFGVITVSSDVSMIGDVFHETLRDVRKKVYPK